MVHRQRLVLPPPAPVILRDGTTAWLRPARPDDIDRLSALFTRASSESLWLRFFTVATGVNRRDLQRMVEIDGVERLTYLITRGDRTEEQVLAVGNYVRLPRWDTAEVAFFVDDTYQGKGLGTILLEHLAERARQQGILTLVADVLPDNHRMLDVFRKSGFAPHVEWEQGTIRVELPATPGEVARAQSEARERVATAASLVPFFKPRSVAVIGASRAPSALGRRVFERLLHTGFAGPVYPVNPHARAIASVRAFPSILDIPDEIDLAVIATPAGQVLEAVDLCARARVRALLVLSAGFVDVGPEKQALQDELVRKVRAHGMRLIGPNCMGLLNTASEVRLNATFSPVFPLQGGVAISSQSGPLGLAILDYVQQFGLGISMFVSVGNKADVSGNDLLQYWEEDPATNLIVLYLESFGNPRKFSRIARRVARKKPILAVKSGRTFSGFRAINGPTTAIASNDRAVDALFHQAGVIRAGTLEELFEIAAVLANQPLPEGKRVAIVTNAKGPGALAADACEAHGLTLPSLSSATVESLQKLLPPEIRLANPVEMLIGARPEHYEITVQSLLRDPNIDALIVLFVPTSTTDGNEVATVIRHAITAAHQETGKDKTVLTCFMSSHGLPAFLAIDQGGTSPPNSRAVPSFRFPESAARALAYAVKYAEWRQQPPGQVPTPTGADAPTARTVIDNALQARGDGWLLPNEVARLVSAAGVSPLIQQKGEDGVEVTITVVEDPTFGPVIGFGLGGAAAEIFNDTAFYITPLTDVDAKEMVRSIRGLPLLQGYRGQPPADLEAIADLLLRVSWLVEELPEVAVMHLHPIRVLAPGQGLVPLNTQVYIRR